MEIGGVMAIPQKTITHRNTKDGEPLKQSFFEWLYDLLCCGIVR